MIRARSAPATGWCRAYLATFAAALCAVAAVLLVQALVDYNDRMADDRITFLRAIDDKCIPLADGQSAIAVRHNSVVRCHVYTRDSPGMARALISSAVAEVPR